MEWGPVEQKEPQDIKKLLKFSDFQRVCQFSEDALSAQRDKCIADIPTPEREQEIVIELFVDLQKNVLERLGNDVDLFKQILSKASPDLQQSLIQPPVVNPPPQVELEPFDTPIPAHLLMEALQVEEKKEPKEEEKKDPKQEVPPKEELPCQKPHRVDDWAAIRFRQMKCHKTKHRMAHPYAVPDEGINLQNMIEVKIEGETRNGAPHGLCFMLFTYAGELESNQMPAKKHGKPFQGRNHWLSFKGYGTFDSGVLSEGPALFLCGNGYSCSFSCMRGGRPAEGCLNRVYHPEGTVATVQGVPTQVDNCLNFIGHVDQNNRGQGRVMDFKDHGEVLDGICKDNNFVSCQRWVPNKQGKYDLKEKKEDQKEQFIKVVDLPESLKLF